MIATALGTALSTFPATTTSVVALAVGTHPSSPPFTGVDVLGFYISSADSTEVWVVTVGRLVRVEVTDSAALVVTWPIERVTRIVELYSAGGYQATVEVDAEALNPVANGRLAYTSYVLSASDVAAMSDLQEFVRQLRLTIGA